MVFFFHNSGHAHGQKIAIEMPMEKNFSACSCVCWRGDINRNHQLELASVECICENCGSLFMRLLWHKCLVDWFNLIFRLTYAITFYFLLLLRCRRLTCSEVEASFPFWPSWWDLPFHWLLILQRKFINFKRWEMRLQLQVDCLQASTLLPCAGRILKKTWSNGATKKVPSALFSLIRCSLRSSFNLYVFLRQHRQQQQ